MFQDRSTKIKELSIVLKWLRRRLSMQEVVKLKFEGLYVETPNAISQAMFTLHDKRMRVLSWLVSMVEYDLKTLATHGKAEGTRGRKPK